MRTVDRSAAVGRRARLRAYGQLGKVKLVDIWLGPLLAWSLAAGTGHGGPRTAALCLLFVAVVAASMFASHAFDDLTGFRDGSDLRNYAPERRRSQVKPLVQGTLTERDAVRFGVSSCAAALVLLAAFCAVADFRPWWLVPAGIATVILGAQYSGGISFSYRVFGGGEALTGATLAATVLLPHTAAVGRVQAAGVIEALLFGCWLVIVLAASNGADAEDDRRVGRRTVAASVPPAVNRAFMAVLVVGSWLLALGASVAGVLGPWVPLGLLPAWVLQGIVLRNGLRGQWRNRRNYGFLAVRLGILGLVVANVLS